MQHGAEEGCERDVHQARLQQRGHDSRVRLPVEGDAQNLAEGTREDGEDSGGEGAPPPAFSAR